MIERGRNRVRRHPRCARIPHPHNGYQRVCRRSAAIVHVRGKGRLQGLRVDATQLRGNHSRRPRRTDRCASEYLRTGEGLRGCSAPSARGSRSVNIGRRPGGRRGNQVIVRSRISEIVDELSLEGRSSHPTR